MKKPPARNLAPQKPKGPSPIPTKDPNAFPMRINKYLALKNYSTRRGADELVTRKQVTINGRIAELGDKVQETDTVEVRSRHKPDEYVYYAYNKPRGVATESERSGRVSIARAAPIPGVFPVGNLDPNAQGLIILTNDRRIVSRFQSPDHDHEKEYLIHTVGPLRPNFKEKIEAGVVVEGHPPVFCTITIRNENTFMLRISHGENRIRQICSLFGAEIESLIRTRILNVHLATLPSGGYRKLDKDEELPLFLKGLGL